MGGFSYGFTNNGFKATGVDIKEEAKVSYKELTRGDFILSDLHSELIQDNEYDVIIGGPPCRPWSSINITRRGQNHPDYSLVSKFLSHIKYHKPKIFIMENVPPLSNDLTLINLISSTKAMGYSVDKVKVTYSHFGASVKRTRLIILGILDYDVGNFLLQLKSFERKPRTVRDSISSLKGKEYGNDPDHVWPNLKTIRKYQKYYETGKYGWRILKWDEPAPSFGNVMKTYTLHPDSSFENAYVRPISIAEAARIMGFNESFQFPEGIPMSKRYQMIVDSVSPIFSDILAQIALNILKGSENYVSIPEQQIRADFK